MITTYKPNLEDLWFREKLMADEETMSYNPGGTLPFPRERWAKWYSKWIDAPENERYYRYLYDTDAKEFVGEIAYRYDEETKTHICDVIVLAEYRNRGYGTAGIRLICNAAKENGISHLYDDIASGNPSVKLFLKNGFEVEYENDEVTMVKKAL